MSPSLSIQRPTEVAAPLSLFEMRVYEARTGCRDRLVKMFEASFRPLYESLGAHIAGSFIDLDAPNRWVWFRAFPDAAARGEALAAFYAHPQWLDLRKATNALIACSSDARLLQPEVWRAPDARRAAVFECVRAVGPSVHQCSAELDGALDDDDRRDGETIGIWASSPAPNTYPRQRLRRAPSRVWLMRFAHAPDDDRGRDRRSESNASPTLATEQVAVHRLRLASTC